MKKITLKKHKNKKNKIIILIIMIIILINVVLKYVQKNISPKLINYAELEIQKLSNLIITKSISLEELEKLNIEDLFIITKNNKNEIMTVDVNTVIINKVIMEATKNIQEDLKKLEKGQIDENNDPNKNGIVLKIPIGEIYNNFILNNLGPKIPVKLKLSGNMESELKTIITNYGINSALIEVNLELSIKEQIILPISTKEIKVTSKLPVAIKLINGTVPNYYSGEINKTSTFSIPIE